MLISVAKDQPHGPSEACWDRWPFWQAYQILMELTDRGGFQATSKISADADAESADLIGCLHLQLQCRSGFVLPQQLQGLLQQARGVLDLVLAMLFQPVGCTTSPLLGAASFDYLSQSQ